MHKCKKRIICSPLVYSDTAQSLSSMGFELVFSCENKNTAPPLAHHADMQLCRASEDIYISAPECIEYYKNFIEKDKIIRGNTYLSCNYPGDIAYNILVSKACAIGNFKYTDSVLLENLKGKRLINISQGYAACTICRISETGYITSDMGVYRALLREKLDVLPIDNSGILLPGYDCGFIGGSSVMLGYDTLGINGDARSLADYDNIKAFCKNYGISVLSMSAEPVMDIGSFIII